MSSKSNAALRKTLAKLAHLDLTGCIHYDDAVMKAHGGYCDVFVGTATIPQVQSRVSVVMKVAIKRLRIHIQKDRDFPKILARELYIWSKLDHTNILRLQGYFLEGDYPVVIAEWMENGTVCEYLQSHLDCSIEGLILGIANGVNYLHGQSVVHSDLKAENVLVNRLGEPLICDFGISRMLSYSATFARMTSGGTKGSMRWMAYELFDFSGDGHHTKESDVWAFGMTVYEILAKQLPYADLKNDGLVTLAIVTGRLPSCPPKLDASDPYLRMVWKICTECWITPAGKRINMGQVVNVLKAGKHINTFEDSEEVPPCPISGAISMSDNLLKDSGTGRVVHNCQGISLDHRGISDVEEGPLDVIDQDGKLQRTPLSHIVFSDFPVNNNRTLHEPRGGSGGSSPEYRMDNKKLRTTTGQGPHPWITRKYLSRPPKLSPIAVQLSPWLAASTQDANSPHIIWDAASKPLDEIRCVTGRGDVVDFTTADFFQEQATQPALQTLKVYIPGLQSSPFLGPVMIEKDSPISVGDIFNAVWEHLHKPLSRSDWSGFRELHGEERCRKVAYAMHRRCQSAAGSYIQMVLEGLKRVDLMEGVTVYCQSQLSYSAMGTWLLHMNFLSRETVT